MEGKIKSLEKKDTTLIEKKEVLKKNYIAIKKDLKIDIKKNICDTILIKEFINDCDSLIAVNDSIIINKNNIIDLYKGVQKSKNEIIDVQNNEIKILKKQVRKEKIKKTIAIICSAVAATLVVIASIR
jgi:hypothetical protein